MLPAGMRRGAKWMVYSGRRYLLECYSSIVTPPPVTTCITDGRTARCDPSKSLKRSRFVRWSRLCTTSCAMKATVVGAVMMFSFGCATEVGDDDASYDEESADTDEGLTEDGDGIEELLEVPE